jgi:hypothetical protein
MTQAARSNLQLRRPPTATTASSRTTPLRFRGAPIGWPCWSPATPPARPSTSRPTTGHAARCCSCPATGREVRRHPLCRVLPHQRVLKRTCSDCRSGRKPEAPQACDHTFASREEEVRPPQPKHRPVKPRAAPWCHSWSHVERIWADLRAPVARWYAGNRLGVTSFRRSHNPKCRGFESRPATSVPSPAMVCPSKLAR